MLQKFIFVLCILSLSCSALTACQPVEGGAASSDPAVSTAAESSANITPSSSEPQSSSSQESSTMNQEPSEDLFADFYPAAEQILSQMTLEEKVGQMFLVRCPRGHEALKAITETHIGGFVLFAEDFENQTPDSIREIFSGYQAAAKIPLLLAVDEEGGSVVRISKFPAFADTPFPSPQDLYQAGGMEAIAEDTRQKAMLLQSLGIHLNLAPVADVSVNPEDYIYNRTFGQPAEETAEYIKVVVTESLKAGLSCTLKHFPGYGNNRDTHTGVALDSRPWQQFEQEDLLPFLAGIEAGVPCIMVSHNIIESVDPSLPASISATVHEKLRSLGFTGLILTDDLDMDAIKKYSGTETPALEALKAGNDLIVISDYQQNFQAVLNAVQSEEISEERIDDSVRRILAWKLSAGVISTTDGDI